MIGVIPNAWCASKRRSTHAAAASPLTALPCLPAQPHAPRQGAPLGLGARHDLAEPAPARGRRRLVDRRPQPGAARRRLRRLLRRTELTSPEVPDFLEEIRGDATLLMCRSKIDDEPPGWALEVDRDGQPLPRAAARQTQRNRPARPTPASGMSAPDGWLGISAGWKCLYNEVDTGAKRLQRARPCKPMLRSTFSMYSCPHPTLSEQRQIGYDSPA